MKFKTFEELLGSLPEVTKRLHVEVLDNIEGEAMAILHFLTPEVDKGSYMDVDIYKVRTRGEDGTAVLIQYMMKMSTKADGSWTLSFTDSPVHGETMEELSIVYSVFPYVYGITPEKITRSIQVPEGYEIH